MLDHDPLMTYERLSETPLPDATPNISEQIGETGGERTRGRSMPRLTLPDLKAPAGQRWRGPLDMRPWTSLPEELKNTILVIALTGNALAYRDQILQDVLWLQALGARLVLVHDGGPDLRQALTTASVAPVSRQGMPVVDVRTLSIMRMALCGQVNQDLVTLAAERGGKAIGLCGIDGQMVQAHVANPALGFIGKVHAVNPHLVEVLCVQGYLPILAPLGQGPESSILAIDPDQCAAHLACALDARMLIMLGNAAGVLRADGSLIAELGESEGYQMFQQGAIPEEQVSRVSACLGALVAVPRIHLAAAQEPHVLLHLCLDGQPKGTRLIREPAPADALDWRRPYLAACAQGTSTPAESRGAPER